MADNHDIGDNPVKPGAASGHPLDPARLADYRRLFGPHRWSLEAGRLPSSTPPRSVCGIALWEAVQELSQAAGLPEIA